MAYPPQPCHRSLMERKNLLIVEDDELLRLSLKRILTREDNYKVFSVRTGEEALKIIEEESLDLILLDLKLPGIHGLEVLRQVRTFDKDVPVIIMSSYLDFEAKDKAMMMGVQEFLEKPFDIKDMKLKIQKVFSAFTVTAGKP